MTDTHFIDRDLNTPIVAAWLNDVNAAVYQALGASGVAPTTPTQVLTNLGLLPTLNWGDTPSGEGQTVPYLDGSLMNLGVGSAGALSTTAGPVAYMEKWGGNTTMVTNKVDNVLSAAYFSKGVLTGGGATTIHATMYKSSTGGDGIALAGHAWSDTANSTNVYGGWFVAGITNTGNTAATAFGIEIDIDNASHDAGYMEYPAAGATIGLWINNSSAGTPVANSTMAIGIAYGAPYRWYTGLNIMWGAIAPEQVDPLDASLMVGEGIMLQGSSTGTAAAGIRLRNYHTTGIDFSGSIINVGIDFKDSTMVACPIRLANSAGIWGVSADGLTNKSMLYLDASNGVVLGGTAAYVSCPVALNANASILTTTLQLNTAASVGNAGVLTFGNSTTPTAGAAAGYLVIYIGSTPYKVPYHAA